MAIDLDDYTPNMKAALKRGGFACVFVASVDGGQPCRVGYATDLGGAVQRLQRTSPVALKVEDAMWVPDRGIATMIAQAIGAAIYPHRKAGGWVDLPADKVAGEMHLTTFRLYPNASTVPHNQLIAKWSRG